jgi:hypothetical protein
VFVTVDATLSRQPASDPTTTSPLAASSDRRLTAAHGTVSGRLFRISELIDAICYHKNCYICVLLLVCIETDSRAVLLTQLSEHLSELIEYLIVDMYTQSDS